MDEQLKQDLKDHIAKTTQASQVEGIYGMCLSIIELSTKQGLKDLSVGLPDFLSWNGENHAPVEEIIKEWQLRPFISRAREEENYQ